ncbi:hypothetical protein GCM10022408_32430 [Hymenobacter fastidiosus]|uniref:DUF3575 domain-containing protein n=1 Tax=Hymenobacter fastidiosus TaxID=486264 RepID=A0ABP7STS7_9BACT
MAVGAEYVLSSRFTLYGQLEADFALARQDTYFQERNPLIPTGALGIGGRYYYNQAGRAQHNRAHGNFIGNYLAVEVHTERQRYFRYQGGSPLSPYSPFSLHRRYTPTLNVLWGMQRRLGRSFLFDCNAGVGLGARRSEANIGYSSGAFNPSLQVNLGLYFGK